MAAGAQRSYPVHIPVGADWPCGMYPVMLTVGDAKARRQIHQALEYLTVAGQVTLNIAADRPGYPTGEQATFTVTGASSRPWQGELALGVYDFRGRLLAVETRPAELATEPREFRFQYRLADHGVRVDTYWAVVVARSGRNKEGAVSRSPDRDTRATEGLQSVAADRRLPRTGDLRSAVTAGSGDPRRASEPRAERELGVGPSRDQGLQA